MTTRRHAPGSCRDLLAELFDYLDGELSEARCRALRRHLDQCPCCGELADNLHKAMTLCRAEGRRRLPAAVRGRARHRIAQLLASGAGVTAGASPRGSSRAATARPAGRR